MYPFLFQIGPIPVPSYGVFAAITLVIAMLAVRRVAAVEGRDPQETMDTMFWSVMVGLVGARVLEAVINWERYFATPGGLKLLVFSTGVFLGGLVAALGYGAWRFRRTGLPVLQGLDILAPVAAIVEAVGRWGCLLSGCCWGTPTDLPWAVTFPELAQHLHRGLPGVPLHPTQIYFSLNGFVLLAIVIWVYKRKRFHGQVITVFVALYAISRFLLEYVRGDAERGFVLGGLLSTSQLVSIGLFAVAVAGYVVLDRRHRASGEPDWKPAAPLRAATARGGRPAPRPRPAAKRR
ncbi:MAG: prolipoprotein diacylglyceryl transferase [Acidobacteria bacterium]|jgi:phosphatidylglycerol:prolipoprotein diacylglycerol transferase|nr:prolipoprotein diacylglyceryl transferase [Acidobacteriota bacterium]